MISLPLCPHLGHRDPNCKQKDSDRVRYHCAKHGRTSALGCAGCRDNPEFPLWKGIPDATIIDPGSETSGLRSYVVTCQGRGHLLAETLTHARAAGLDPTVLFAPPPVLGDYARSSADYLRCLQRAQSDGCEWSLILEDDVTVDPRILDRLASIRAIQRLQFRVWSLFTPDVIDQPWEVEYPEHGYRIPRQDRLVNNAKPWQRNRLWGSQAYLLHKSILPGLIAAWPGYTGGQDARLLRHVANKRLPFAYTCPDLVQHRPQVSNFGTPPAYSRDFGARWRCDERLHPDLSGGWEPAPELHQPDGIEGWLSREEAAMLWDYAAGMRCVELGTYKGKATVVLAQSAHKVTSIDLASQADARLWLQRWGLIDRVTLIQSDVALLDPIPCDLIYLDTNHDAGSVRRDLEFAAKCGATVIAIHDYPDPGWPDVRRVVDPWMRARGWARVAQAGFLAVFRTVVA